MQPMDVTNTTHKFMHHLSMALCEWFLIFLMFMDAALGYILTKFAHHCELQSPCMFCLRLDHVFGEKPGSFLSLFCNKHRAEVSDLISCQLHHTLADVREMCDDCFMSIMKRNDNKKPFLNKSFVRVPSSNGTCSCCKIEWNPKPRSGLKLGVSKISTKPTMSRGGARGHGRFRRRNDFKRVRDVISGNSTPYHIENNVFMDMDVDMDTDALSDSGCADLRFYSGSDSDDSFYEVDCGEDGCYNDDFRIISDKSILNQAQVRPEQPCSVSNSEPSFQNVDPKGIITGPESLKSDGSIGVKENSPLQVGKEKRDYNQDFQSFKDHKDIGIKENDLLEVSKEKRDDNQGFHSFKDHKEIVVKENGPIEVGKQKREYKQDFYSFKEKVIDEKENGPLEVVKETGDYNQDFVSFKDHGEIGVKENGPLNVSKETRDYNQDFHSFKEKVIDEKENSPLEVGKETRDYNQDQDFHSFKDHKAIGIKENGPHEVNKETRDYNQDFHSFKDHKAIDEKENAPLEVIKERRDFYNQDFHSFKDHDDAIVVKENDPLEVIKENDPLEVIKENGPLEVIKVRRDYNQDFHSFKDHKVIDENEIEKEKDPLEVIKETRDYNRDFQSFKDHDDAIGVKDNSHLQAKKEPKDYNQVFYSFKYHTTSPSSDKHEGYESTGSSGLSEIEGESDVEKLKRQVGHYQQRLRLLQKELEEERNAAAIAADEAMAMITRLQEEKAALHMEASQYLRMMDEQAEYDMEAVDKANDLVAEKDKEIQDLEAELEYFRNRYEDELFKSDDSSPDVNKSKENRMENGKIEVNSSFILGLEEEKKYILQSLSDLKRKFDQFSNGNVADNGLLIDDEVDVGTLENDILDLNERLETLEADRDFLERACNTLQSKGGLEFVQEIAHHLHDSRRVRFDRRC
ncbi:uncharacterized protein [Rutidosis leptorrhynchoides]|uniref:uncharacterized protein n=1 Tax=Rutidosis leptorrhynchoides TaxID=125765 RepID=UPI003A99CB1A